MGNSVQTKHSLKEHLRAKFLLILQK